MIFLNPVPLTFNYGQIKNELNHFSALLLIATPSFSVESSGQAHQRQLANLIKNKKEEHMNKEMHIDNIMNLETLTSNIRIILQ